MRCEGPRFLSGRRALIKVVFAYALATVFMILLSAESPYSFGLVWLVFSQRKIFFSHTKSATVL